MMMNRRSFIKIAGVGIVVPNLFACTNLSYYYRKLKGKFFRKDNRVSQKNLVSLPGWEKVTVETALNSRCMSDYDDDPQNYHWGIANGAGRLSEEQLMSVESNAKFRRFTDGILWVDRKGNIIHFSIDPKSSGKERMCLNIEIGLILQTFGMVCAAMGIAVVIQSYEENGSLIDGKWRILSYRLEPMKPSYKTGFWTSDFPKGERRWLSGNLPDPDRAGSISLGMAIKSVAENIGGSSETIDMNGISQLLWAARGRTPHFYLSKPWGMTIPVAYGIQERSGVYVISEGGGINHYINWNNGPTHSLEKVAADYKPLLNQLLNNFSSKNMFILLTTNETTGYAEWETGFMLQNILLQAASLNCKVESVLGTKEMDFRFNNNTVCAIVALTKV